MEGIWNWKSHDVINNYVISTATEPGFTDSNADATLKLYKNNMQLILVEHNEKIEIFVKLSKPREHY